MARAGVVTRRTQLGRPAALAAAGAGVLAGCAVPGASGTAPAGGKTRAPVTLRVQTRTGLDLDKYWLLRKADFEASLPHVTLEVEAIAGGPLEYVTKLLVLHSGGGLGDAAWGTSRAGYTKALASKNVFAAVEPLARADKLNLGEYYPRALAESTHNGKLVALPHITEPGRAGLIWNKSLFAGTAAKEPDLSWTYETLRDTAAGVSRGPSDAREVFGVNGSYGYLEFMPVLRAFGGDLLAPDGTRCVLESPQALAAVQWQHDMIRRLGVAPAPGQAASFNTGQVAMQPANPMTAQSTANALKGSFQLGSTLLPKGPTGKRGSILVSHTMGVTTASRAMDEAWAWTRWSCSKDFAVHRLLSGNGGPGGRPDVWRDEQVLKEIVGWKDWADLMDGVMPHHIPANLRGQEVEESFSKQLNAIWAGQMAPADAVKQAVGAINEILRQPAA